MQSLPFLLLAIPAGLLADRSSRRTILAFAEALRALSFGLILLLIAVDSLTLSTLGLLGFVGAIMLHAAYVPYAAHYLGFSAFEVGATMAGYGLGMVAGAVMAGSVLYPSLALVMLSFFLFGAGPILWTISTTTLRQAVTPSDMISRVSAVIMTLTYGARPVGALIAAAIGSIYPAEYCILAASVGFIVQLAIIASSTVPRLTSIPEESRHFAA